MSRNTKSVGRAANGLGSIRYKTVKKNGKEYSYWEGRVTVGINPKTGKQKQRSVTGKTQKEVTQRMKEIAVKVDNGTYRVPTKMTVAEWTDKWLNSYNQDDVKDSTAALYKSTIELYIKPRIGKVKLEALTPLMVQDFFNSLKGYVTRRGEPLSPKTIKNIRGVLHKLLQQAVDDKQIAYNPVDGRKTPRVKKKEASYMEEDTQAEFIKAIRGHRHEYLFLIALFTGMRQGEILGLTWDCIDLNKNLLHVKQQLKKASKKSGKLGFVTTKNDKSRTIAISPSVAKYFRLQKLAQNALRIEAGDTWIEHNLVFSNPIGDYLSYRTVYDCFKRVVVKLGAPDVRFHDLRHTYAANCICAGDDIKTLQKNMGHATAAFTLDTYAHVFDKMQKRSANRTEAHIQNLLAAAK